MGMLIPVRCKLNASLSRIPYIHLPGEPWKFVRPTFTWKPFGHVLRAHLRRPSSSIGQRCNSQIDPYWPRFDGDGHFLFSALHFIWVEWDGNSTYYTYLWIMKLATSTQVRCNVIEKSRPTMEEGLDNSRIFGTQNNNIFGESDISNPLHFLEISQRICCLTNHEFCVRIKMLESWRQTECDINPLFCMLQTHRVSMRRCLFQLETISHFFPFFSFAKHCKLYSRRASTFYTPKWIASHNILHMFAHAVFFGKFFIIWCSSEHMSVRVLRWQSFHAEKKPKFDVLHLDLRNKALGNETAKYYGLLTILSNHWTNFRRFNPYPISFEFELQEIFGKFRFQNPATLLCSFYAAFMHLMETYKEQSGLVWLRTIQYVMHVGTLYNPACVSGAHCTHATQ